MSDNDAEILGACQRGELDKFSKLYDKYIGKIYNFIYYKTWHRQTAEDLTSRTFLKAVENIGKFAFNKGSFQAWLYRIARNCVIDYYRTNKEQVDIDDVGGLMARGEAGPDWDNKQLLERVLKYLEQVDREHKEIFIMRLWDGLPYKEIAAIVGKTEANCKMIFSRTLVKLKNEIILILLFIIINFFSYG